MPREYVLVEGLRGKDSFDNRAEEDRFKDDWEREMILVVKKADRIRALSEEEARRHLVY